MSTTWQIRKAKPKDANGLKSCMKSSYGIYQDRIGAKRLPPMDVDYLSEIKNYPTWVVDFREPLDNNILGGLIMVFENNEASIANIAVDAKFQGQGIGGALMGFAESKAKEKHFSKLRLATHILLLENISLYKHLGWVETSRDNTRVFFLKII